VTIDAASGPALVLALATPRASEFTFPPRRFRARAPQPGSQGATRAALFQPEPSPLYPWTLSAGAVCLFVAALLGAFSRSRA
jgi:hypothetical protein